MPDNHGFTEASSVKICRDQREVSFLRRFANGDSLDDLLRAYPLFTREDFFACLNNAASIPQWRS